MIKHLRVVNNPKVVNAVLQDLGYLNILCGRNNSGKTTILESLRNSGTVGVGRELNEYDYVIEIFEKLFDSMSSPHPTQTKPWFRTYIDPLFQTRTIWYSDELERIFLEMVTSANSVQYFRGFSDLKFLRTGLDQLFQKPVSNYSSLLLPPKRKLEHEAGLRFDVAISPAGDGVLNRLFFLKSQPAGSNERKKFDAILSAFQGITGSKFDVIPQQNNTIVINFLVQQSWISGNQCGLGLSDVLIIVYFVIDTDSAFLLIEEPENHLHAEYQKNLLSFLKTRRNRQFIISTHSPIFLDTAAADSIFYVNSEADGIHLSNQTSKSQIARSLGLTVSDNLVSDLVFLVEGPTDIPVVRQVLEWLGIGEYYNIRFWPLGGDIMSGLDLSVLSESKKVFALIDNDPGSSKQRTRFLRNCKDAQIPCCRLERCSIENYFSLEAVRKVFPGQVPSSLASIDPEMTVDEQLGFKSKGKTVKSKNLEIISSMSIGDLLDTDLLKFLGKVKVFLENTRSSAFWHLDQPDALAAPGHRLSMR